MTWIEATARYLGISEEEARNIDSCDLTEEDEEEISRIMEEGE